MKKFLGIFIVFSFVVWIFRPAQECQAAGSKTFLHTETVETSAFPEVSLQFSAWDASGLPLEGLLPEHFTLREDSGAVFHPASLEVDKQAPVRVVLAIDVSESMLGAPLNDAKSAAARFLDRLSPGQDQVALIGFSGEIDPSNLAPEREIGFTSEMTNVYNLVEGLQARGMTHLYDAAAKAVGLFEDTPPGHRAVLLLSDGRNDPPGAGDPHKAIAIAKELNVPFFVIGLGDQVDQPYLQRLAYETGGLFLPVPRSAELADLFHNMATLLKTRYLLTYISKLPADGNTHALNLTLNLDDTETQIQVPMDVPFQATVVPPLPSIVPTQAILAAVVTASQPTQFPTPTPSAPPAPGCASSVESFGCFITSPWSWVLGLVILAGAGILIFRPRRRRTPPEACAKCGYDLTDLAGPCPQCGETKRLPKK